MGRGGDLHCVFCKDSPPDTRNFCTVDRISASMGLGNFCTVDKNKSSLNIVYEFTSNILLSLIVFCEYFL